MKWQELKKKLTFKRVTKAYLWWVVIRWFLRWVATFAFLWYMWYLAPEESKERFLRDLKFKYTEPAVLWIDEPYYITVNKTNMWIEIGLREDNTVEWRKIE